MADKIKMSVTNCARCGKSHEQVLVQKLQKPILHNGETIGTHFATCPLNAEPIIVKIEINHRLQRQQS